jgi:hypothetical protein
MKRYGMSLTAVIPFVHEGLSVPPMAEPDTVTLAAGYPLALYRKSYHHLFILCPYRMALDSIPYRVAIHRMDL